MKNIFVLLLLVFVLSCSSDENSNDNNQPPETNLDQFLYNGCNDFVQFNENDNSFLLYLRSLGYDLNNDGQISCAEAELITTIDFGESLVVESFNGIEAFTNLQSIYGIIRLNINFYPSEEPTTLNLYNNINLQEINLNDPTSFNMIGRLVLPNSNNLKVLDLGRTSTWELLNITAQANLETLKINGNLANELNLSECNSLKIVDLNENALTSVIFSSDTQPNMEELRIGKVDNQYQDYEDINHISSIDLSIFPNLKVLFFKDNDVLSEIDFSNNNLLEEINLQGNQITQIDISNLINLKQFNIGSNEIPNIDVSNNINLEGLAVFENYITFLDVTNNTQLNNLHASNNIISNLDLTNNPQINYLRVNDNLLDFLDLRNETDNFLPTFLYTNNNELDCIYVSDSQNIPNNMNNWVLDSNTQLCY